MDENKNEEQTNIIEEEIDDNIIIEKIPTNDGETKIKKYKKIRLLGKGGFARCYELFDEETHKSYAVKIIKKTSLIKSRTKQKLISEIKIHKSLNHENIVKFEHYFEDAENVYILLELCYNQTLHELIKLNRIRSTILRFLYSENFAIFTQFKNNSSRFKISKYFSYRKYANKIRRFRSRNAIRI